MLDVSVVPEAADNNDNCIASVARCNGDQSRNRFFKGAAERQAQLRKNQVLEVGTIFVRESEQDVEDFNYRNLRHLLLVQLVPQSNYEYQLVLQASTAGGAQAESAKTIQLLKAEKADKDSESKPVDEEADYHDNQSIRKAILLSRYTALLREWSEERARAPSNTLTRPGSKKNSMVAGDWQSRFSKFEGRFRSEMKEIGDSDLEKELEVLSYLT